MRKLLKKRCLRCGHLGPVGQKQRRCHRLKQPGSRYWCYGVLETVRPPKKERKPKVAPTPTERALKEKARAENQLAKYQRRLKVAERMVKKWRGKVRAFDRLANRTPEEIAAAADRAQKAAQVNAVLRRLDRSVEEIGDVVEEFLR